MLGEKFGALSIKCSTHSSGMSTCCGGQVYHPLTGKESIAHPGCLVSKWQADLYSQHSELSSCFKELNASQGIGFWHFSPARQSFYLAAIQSESENFRNEETIVVVSYSIDPKNTDIFCKIRVSLTVSHSVKMVQKCNENFASVRSILKC